MTAGRKVGKPLQLGLVTALAVFALLSFSPTAFAQVFGVPPGGVLEVQIIRGNPAWQASTAQRIQGSAWGFFPNGVFGHDEPDTRRDLFPIWGRYEGQGNTVSFEAVRTSTIGGTGSAYAYVTGTVQTVNGQLVLTAYIATGMGNGAVVNGQQFLNNAEKLYRTSVVLQRIQ